ncbi:peptidoglycan DD-metalloendopeptidase family protein [Patescibacteria group bacterium]|nr:peptidoglycan DD-metalloendopeptidase family protein [Patescibacteria group bacterium]
MFKLLINLKDLIAKTIPALIQPFFWLIKFIFYRPFLRLYYIIFRVKKYDLGQQSKKELIKKKSLHVAALILIFIAIVLNLTDKKQANAAIGKTQKSVMAEIVANEFSDIGQNNDELIQETARTVNPEALNVEKYLGSKTGVIALKGLISESEQETEKMPSLIRNDNMLAKPQQINIGEETRIATNSNNNERTEIIIYKVQPGDTISTIARSFRLNVNTVLWANDLSAFSIIRIGDELTILPSNGFLYKVKSGDTIGKLAQTYDTTAQEIINANNLSSAGTITIGRELIIPGTKITAKAPVRNTAPSSYSAIEVIKDIVTANKPITSSNKMLWPTEGSRITQYFSWQHNGLDIANKIGTPIYAADSGVVEISQGGYNGGYGNTILLNHGGGIKTRYGHASKLLVKKGDEVEKGQVIALMGSTGRSTGSHLHFEVVINGTRYNPLNYIK